MKLGIYAKVILLFFSIIILFSCGLGYYIIKYQTQVLNVELDDRATVLINNLAFNSEYPVLIRDYDAIGRLLKGVLAQRDIVFVRIEDKEGNLLYQEGSKKGPVREFTTTVFTKMIEEEIGEELILGVTKEKEEKIGMIYLAVSLSGLNHKLNRVKKTIVILVIAAIIFASLVTYLLLKHILGRPIAQLVSATERISKGDLNYRVPIKTKDEIGFLSVSFNKMTENLQETLKEIKAKGYEIKVLNALNEIITTANKHLNIEDVVHPTLNVVIRSIGELAKEGGMNIKKVTGGLFLHDEKNGRLVLSAVQGISTKSLGCKGVVPTGECLCGLAASSGEIVFSPYCLANSRDITMPSPHPEKDHANISIPLMSGDKVTGILFLYLSPSGHQPGASEIAIFTSIGNYVGLNIDKAKLYEQMQELAIQDGLTGLYNHREFQRYLEMEVNRTTRHSEELSLMLIDIDHFKRFNDTYGHLSGDEALRTIGRILKEHTRNVDIAARYGGEEFAIILPDTPLQRAVEIAERLRSTIENYPINIEGKAVYLTISIGVASFPSDSETRAGLTKASDQALYRAKETGRNRVCQFAETKTPGSASNDKNKN